MPRATTTPTAGPGSVTSGVALAAVSAMSFGMSGPLASALIDAGWSSTAATLLRLGLGAVVLVVPAAIMGRRRLATIARAPWSVLAYGVMGVAMVQLCFFNAVRHLDVAVALLIEYSAPVLVLIYRRVVGGHRAGRLTLLGAAVAIAGLVTVVIGGAAGWSIDPIGVLWAGAAAVGLAGYFLIAGPSARVDVDGRSRGDVDPVALTCGGLVIGALLVGAAGAVGLLPMTASTADVTLAGGELPWWTAAVAVAVISTAIAYVTGIAAVRRLGPTLASFVALVEVITSATASWILLGQSMSPAQMAGAVVMLCGIVTVRRGTDRGDAADATQAVSSDVDPRTPHTKRALSQSERRSSYSTSPRS
ncbi:EamA family transporter [Williamsia herbipolensis]|uniref:EamA family transporter n=1 Tax=Williamsia herbipolensis TaxID=1603258 RepID=UPI0009E5EE17|nr:DMT family transporter [Williamsia herbipolensis]